MNSKDFTAQLLRENNELLAGLRCPLAIKQDEKMNVRSMLKMALKNEFEATELAAAWIPSTPEIDVKMGFARQAGDEAKHYRLIEERLRALGENPEGFNPIAAGFGPLFKFLITLEHTVERVAAGQFTREAIALIKNEQFIEFAEAAGDRETAKLYRETIQPDETHHHELGRRMLEKYAVTDDLQQRAREASRRTLELAEELQGMVLQKTGVHHAPGC